jgi:uncharacterized protein (TIGR02285 family)
VTVVYKPLFACLVALIGTPCLAANDAGASPPKAQADARPTVIWARTAFPPYFLLDGARAGEGIADQTQRALTTRIKQFAHISSEMTLKRFIAEAKSGKSQICHAALLKNEEREQFLEYSDPVQIGLGNGLVVTQQGLALLGIDHERDSLSVSAEQLRDKGFKVAYQEARVYSRVIDAAIANDPDATIFHTVDGADNTNTLLRMVAANRLDGAIARPHEASFFEQTEHPANSLYYIEIEGAADVSPGYIGCSMGDWNDTLLSEINRLNKTPEVRDAINKAVLDWMPQSLAPRYLRQAAKYFPQGERQGTHSVGLR